MNISSTRRRGLTLIELLLATAGTGFVATAIAVMLNAISFGTSSGTDLRQAVVKQKTITSRITAAIRSSYMVLAAEDDLLVLWTNDNDADGEPNLGEIQRIERDEVSKEMRSYAAPKDLAEVSNTSYPLDSTDFKSVTAALRDTANFPEEVWATAIGQWTVSLDSENLHDALLISTRLQVDVGDYKEVALATAALRNQGTTSFIASDISAESEGEESVDGGGGGGSSKGKGKSKGKSKSDDDDDDGKGKGDDDDDDSGKGKSDDDDDDSGKSKSDDDDDDSGKGKSDDDDDDSGKGKSKDDDD